MGAYSDAVDKWLEHIRHCHSCISGAAGCMEGIALNHAVDMANKLEDESRK